MSRLRAAIVVLAVIAAGLVAPSEARAAGVGLLDRDVVALDASGTSFTRTSGPEDVLTATVSPSNQIVLSTSNSAAPTVTLTLGDGTRPQPGGYYLLNGTTKNSITGICGGINGGHLSVEQVVYSGDTVTELSATYGTSCSALGYSSGAIRVGTTEPYAVVRPPVVDTGKVPTGHQAVTTVAFTNTGEAATGTLGPATVGTNIVGVTDFSIVADRCGGRTLAPSEACTVDVGFRRDTSGTSTSLVKLPDATYPGRQLVTGITATAVPLPTAPAVVLPFPVAGGQGLAWSQAYNSITSYRVLKSDGTTWTDVSGPLSATTYTWVDRSLAPGASATYAVVATNSVGDGPQSAAVEATRLSQDATAGPYSVMTDDRDQTEASPYAVGPSIARDVTLYGGWGSTTPQLGSSIGMRGLPALLPGPGRYADTFATGPLVRLPDSDSGCVDGHGVLVVDAVGYLADGTLDTLTAHTVNTCDGTVVAGHLNYRSPSDVAAIGITPLFTSLPGAQVGAASDTVHVAVTNTGGLPVTLGPRGFNGPSAGDWSIVSDTCPDVLPVGGDCAVDVHAVPTHSGDRAAELRFSDSTLVGSHGVHLTVHAIGLPSAPTSVAAVRLPFGGVDLTWDWPSEDGGEGATHWYVRRQAGGSETTFTVGQEHYWADLNAPAGATYTVSMENTLGEGPQSAAVTPTASVDVVVSRDVFSSASGVSPKLAGFAPDGRQDLPWRAAGVSDEVVAATSSPDGRSVAVVRQTSAGSYEVWRQAVDAATAPVLLWSSSAPIRDLAWSPDGSRFAVASTSGTTPGIAVVDAATGRVLSFCAEVGDAAWLPDSRTYVATAFDNSLTLVRVDASTGKRLGSMPGSPAGYLPSISPDARWLTYRNASSSALVVVALSGGTPHEVSSLTDSQKPVWAPDGLSFIVQNGGDPLYHSIHRVGVGADGTPTAPVQVPVRNDASFPLPAAWAGRRVAIGAMPAVTGRVATVPVVMTSFPAGTSLSCAVDSGAFAACATAWQTPGLNAGTHMVRVRTVEPGGRMTVAARSFVVDTAAPVARPTALPVALVGTATRLGFSGTDTGGSTVASYDVRYQYASPTSGFTAPSQPAIWQNLRGTSLALTLSKGYSYCFAIRARDAVGNVGPWSAETCTNVAFDDRALAGTGWSRLVNSVFWLNTYTTAAASGRVLSVRASARQVGLVVARCWACGTLDARINGVYLGRVSLTYPATEYREVVWFPAGILRSGTLTLTTVGTKRVHVDGVVLRH